MSLRPALFLDRDGVINEEVNYLWRPEDCRLVAGIDSLLRTAHDLDFAVIVVTNQAGIGRGMYSEADFHRLMQHMAQELRTLGAGFDAVYFSPYHPEHGIGDYRKESECRKPGPGMLFRAAEEHGLDLTKSILVGDRCSDIAAGAAAGVSNLFLYGTTEVSPCAEGAQYTAITEFAPVKNALRRLAGTGNQTS